MIQHLIMAHVCSDSNKGDSVITQAPIDGLQKSTFILKTLFSIYRNADTDFWYRIQKIKLQYVYL
ncbi:hypothetical protein ACJD0Z_00275 [Flavobacteriaceae bacterium M23B6Z8]